MTQGKSRMRQYRMSGSVRGAAREGGSYRDKVQVDRPTGSDITFTTIFGFPFFFLLESRQIIIHDSVL